MLFQPDSDERENEGKVKEGGEGCASTKWGHPESGRNGSEGQCHWAGVGRLGQAGPVGRPFRGSCVLS